MTCNQHITNAAASTWDDDSACTCNEELVGSRGSEYRGCQSVTRSGKSCQAWSSQDPHEHTRTPENYPDFGLDFNLCRNPDIDTEPGYTIWCYTTESDSRWEYCDPTDCDEELSGEKDSGYRGCQIGTRSGPLCQAWSRQYPHTHTITAENYPEFGLESNYCRNPDGGDTIWCYTTDDYTEWEYCDPLPDCNEELSGDKGSGYRGCQTVTRSGIWCQAWSSQYPIAHSVTPENYPDSGLERNYCRNPDGGDTIWCYTSHADPNDEHDEDLEWDYCDPISG
jgi:hypothetical protein